MLDISRKYWSNLNNKEKNTFKFVHISTDEVYGSLKKNDLPFTEENRFKPNSPYSASKASSDHLVRSYYKTYSFPAIISNCSNNYGPYQFPEKLIPLVIQKCLLSENIPVYGNGLQVRDWLHVQDHCTAIKLILKSGKNGQVYNIGGKNEKTNIEVVNYICEKYFIKPQGKDMIKYKTKIKDVAERHK